MELLNQEIYSYLATSENYESLDSHFHHLYEMILVTEGKAEFIIHDKKYLVSANEVLFISNLEKHSVKILEYPYQRYVTLMSSKFALSSIKEPTLFSILTHRPKNFPYAFKLDDLVLKKVEHLTQELIKECENKETFWNIRTAYLVSSMLIDIYRYNEKYFYYIKNNETDKIIFEIQKYILDNYEREILLDELSEKFFLSKYYISRKFKEITGFTFKDYILLNRITKSKELLRYTNKTVNSISSEIGYNNVNQFIRLFKQFENITPTKYRKKYSAK